MRIVRVRDGQVTPQGSWIYVWIDVELNDVVYVGGTPFDPELRAHMHLTDPDPRIGRIRAMAGDVAARDLDVLAFPLAEDVDRAATKRALVALLNPADLAGADESAAAPLAAAREIAEVLRTRGIV